MFGGTVIVQNPDTAAFPGMPLSLSMSDVDLTLQVERIPELLDELVKGGYEVPPISDNSMLRTFLEELREESGVDFTTYRQATILRRVQRRMVASGISSIQEYLRMVRRNPEERQHLVKSFLINVTRFFRDEELFAYLREHVLPELIRDAAHRNEELRIWSAGCSTGEEAYSLAILVHELLEGSDYQMSARIFATDLDEDAVAFARQGVFPARALSELPQEIIERYFTQIGDEFEVRKSIRGMLVFGEHDLARRAPFPRIDMILCRNVLIYFTLPLQRRALELFAFSLRNGGYLVLGKSETISPLGEHFVPDQSALKVFRRVGTRTQMVHSRIRDVMPLPPPKLPAIRDPQLLSRSRAAKMAEKSDPSNPLRDVGRILYTLPCGVVVVNRTYDVLFINTEARRLFGIHTAAVDQDFIHLVQRYDPIAIRRLIDRVVQTGEPADEVLTSNDARSSAFQSVELSCRVVEQDDGQHIALLGIDVSEREQIRARLAAAEETSARLIKANDEVLSVNHQLSSTIQVLRDDNEQLQVTSAEIQAATEEVETLNEELQASNEELETLNEELQATIEELNTTNDDLAARSLELQSMALAAENARHELRVILDAVADGILVVDEQGSIVFQSQSFTDLFGDHGQPPIFLDRSGVPLHEEDSPVAKVVSGEEVNATFKVRERGGTVGLYDVTGCPTTPGNGQRRGVLTIRRHQEPQNQSNPE